MTDPALAMPSPGGPYSQWCRRGDVVAIAGQTGTDLSGVLAQTAEQQIGLALRNLQTALRAAGGELGDVVAVRVYLASLGDFEVLNDACRRVFDEPYPARTTIGALLPGRVLVEIDALAVISRTGPAQDMTAPVPGSGGAHRPSTER